MNEKRRVVITGVGTYNPLGHDLETTWQKLMNGESGIGPITQFDATEFRTQFAGEVKDFDADDIFGKREARRMSRMTQFALAATSQAIEDAKLKVNEDNRDRIGVILGSGMGSMEPIIENAQILSERGPLRVSPFFVPMMLPDTPAAAISIIHGMRGPNMSVATACATGNNVIGEATKLIQRGAVEVMVAGGAEACINPLAIAGFSIMKAMSQRNEDPQRALRPFDLNRDGFVTSEGSAVFILETLENALARDAYIYGEVLGYGTSADAYHLAMPAENGEGAVKSMANALKDAGFDGSEIDYINAHGTATQLNDKGETAAIKSVFGERAYDIPVSSTKSLHGHLLGAAGALEAAVCLKAIAHNTLPPTMNYETPDPECDLDYVPNAPRPAELNIAMSNGFGLGGHNATIILGKYNGS